MEERRKRVQLMERECLKRMEGPAKAPGRRGSAPCQVLLSREYWIPPLPGYTGYVVGKYSENVMGGTRAHCAREAARAIGERLQHEIPQEQEVVGGLASPEKIKKALKQVGEHCDRQIPGYMGHIPLLRREPVFGGTFRKVCDATKKTYQTRPRLDLDN